MVDIEFVPNLKSTIFSFYLLFVYARIRCQSIKRRTDLFSILLLGNEKVATICKHILKQFQSVFEESLIYDVTRFNVQEGPKTYKTVNEDLIIVIRTDTRAVKITESGDMISRFKFTFADDSTLVARLYQIENLTDLGGILHAITTEIPVTTNRGTRTTKRELHIETDRYNKVVLSLWVGQRNLIDESVIDKYAKSPSIVVTSLTVSAYGGTFTFSTTKATKIYMDIDDSQLHDITSSDRR